MKTLIVKENIKHDHIFNTVRQKIKTYLHKNVFRLINVIKSNSYYSSVLEMFVVTCYSENKHCFNLTFIKSQRPTLVLVYYDDCLGIQY